MKKMQGNVFDSNLTVFAHGVNCIGAFGGGVAGYIRQHFTRAFDAYSSKPMGWWQLGKIQRVKFDTGMIIYNCATQFDIGGQRAVNYEALYSVLYRLAQEHDAIAIPAIGCGLAKGNVNILYAMIEDIESKTNCEFEVWTL